VDLEREIGQCLHSDSSLARRVYYLLNLHCIRPIRSVNFFNESPCS
jgi:hypothetical protein